MGNSGLEIAKKLTATFSKTAPRMLLKIKLNGETVVNLGYPQNILNRKGFGYLVSSKE